MARSAVRGLTRATRSGASALRLVRAAQRQVLDADRGGTLVAFGLQVLGALVGLGMVVAAKLAFDALLAGGDAALGPAAALLLLALATALSGSVGGLQAQQQRLLGERVAQRVWEQVLHVAARVDLITYESTGFSTQLDRVQQNALSRPFEVTANLLALTGSVLGVGTMSVVLVGIEPLLVPLLLAAGIPAVLLSRWAGRAEYAFVLRATPPYRRRSYVRRLLVDRAYAAELRAFGSTTRLRQRHRDLDAEYLSALRRQVRTRQLIAVLTTVGVGIALAAALLAIVELVARGRISLSEAGAAAIAVRMLSGQLTTAFTAIGGLLEATPFLGDLDSFVRSVPPPSPAGRRRRLDGGVVLSGVSFRYPGQPRPTLDRIDLEIRAGEVVALVGENGSGKTTLAKIVSGLYEPEEGSLTWDGTAVPASDDRASVSVIFQDFVRYQMTVRENITLGDPDRLETGSAVSGAARRAGVMPAVERLPDGMETILGRDIDEGVDLSGGEWQRLALARALYRGSDVVVLDEPTAALDPRAEHELFNDVRVVLDGRAALLISHRFSSVRLADRIYVLDGGRVRECGTHDELMARGGHYAELFDLQSAGYR